MDYNWHLGLPVRTPEEAITCAKWALAAGAAEARRRGAVQVAATYSSRSAQADDYYAGNTVPAILNDVVSRLDVAAPTTAKTVRRIAAGYVRAANYIPPGVLPQKSYETAEGYLTPTETATLPMAPLPQPSIWDQLRPYAMPAGIVAAILLALKVARS